MILYLFIYLRYWPEDVVCIQRDMSSFSFRNVGFYIQAIVSREQVWPWSLEICTQRIFNHLIKQNRKLGSDSVLQQSMTVSMVQSPKFNVQSPGFSIHSPESSIQLFHPESRNSGMPHLWIIKEIKYILGDQYYERQCWFLFTYIVLI